MAIRSKLAQGVGKGTSWALKNVFKRTASHLPGLLALKIDPELLGTLKDKLTQGSVVVCGTNGKTTTTNVIASAIESTGRRVLCNRVGANMLPGITGALLPGDEAEWAVLECDELSTIHVLPRLKPSYLLLLNLFRDQLDRTGEIDRVQETIVQALEASPTTTLVACGDDPLSASIALRVQEKGMKVLSFGIGEPLNLPAERVSEAKFCQVCGAELEYDYHTYAQLGAFRCPKGDFSRPELDFSATDVEVTREGVAFTARRKGEETASLKTDFGGVYMVYNMLAAWTIGRLAGVGSQSFQHTLDTYKPENGRLQRFMVKGREVILNLAKNPAGFNQNISLVLTDERPKAVFLLVNDLVNDGHDISWIWDMDLERLAEQDMPMLCGGLRANDLQVRAKYAGIEAGLAQTVSEAIDQLSKLPLDHPLYVLANYSALFPAKDELEKVGNHYE